MKINEFLIGCIIGLVVWIFLNQAEITKLKDISVKQQEQIVELQKIIYPLLEVGVTYSFIVDDK